MIKTHLHEPQFHGTFPSMWYVSYMHVSEVISYSAGAVACSCMCSQSFKRCRLLLGDLTVLQESCSFLSSFETSGAASADIVERSHSSETRSPQCFAETKEIPKYLSHPNCHWNISFWVYLIVLDSVSRPGHVFHCTSTIHRCLRRGESRDLPNTERPYHALSKTKRSGS